MIKIHRETDITLLSASVTDFADSLGYCEYKIPLSIQGIKPNPSQSLILGTKAHSAEQKYEQEHMELEPVSFEQIEDKQEDIEFARENIHTTLMMPFEFPTGNALLTLSGRIDKILRVDETLVVQDDKFAGRPQIYDDKTQPYPSQLLQVLTYLNSSYSVKRAKTLRISLKCHILKRNGRLEYVTGRLGTHTKYSQIFKMPFHYIICMFHFKSLQPFHLELQLLNIITAKQSVMRVI